MAKPRCDGAGSGRRRLALPPAPSYEWNGEECLPPMTWIDYILLTLAAATLLALLLMGGELLVAGLRLRRLIDLPPAEGPDLPTVSVIVAARDEVGSIESALKSLLSQDYPRLEIVVIDDRSTDGTGAVLDRLAADNPSLRVVHVAELPPGWLGKNHALHEGARGASGELLLFADADIVMRPTAVSRAVGYLLSEKADHVTAAPGMTMPTVAARLGLGAFQLIGMLFARPWRCADPRSRRFVGIGAFNLVRAEAYHKAGGHRRIALRPDDDMMLGKIVKASGGRQRLLIGRGAMSVEWYPSLPAMARGLEKNSFSGFEYSLTLLVAASVFFVMLLLWPVAALFLTTGWTLALNAAVVAWAALVYAGTNGRFYGLPAWHGLLYPVAVVLILWMIWRASLLTIRHGGISWRGTRYALRDLRANRV